MSSLCLYSRFEGIVELAQGVAPKPILTAETECLRSGQALS
jgi:hypothetical protein